MPGAGPFCSPGPGPAASFQRAIAGVWVWNSCRRGQEIDPTSRVAGCGLPLFLTSGCTGPSGLDGGPGREIPLSDTYKLWDKDISACRKRGWCEQSQSTTGKPKCPSAPRLELHRPLGYSLSLHLAENSWRSHSETSFSDSARIPRGKKSSTPKGICLPFGRRWRGAAIFSQQRSSPKEIFKMCIPARFRIKYCGASTLQMSWVGFTLFVLHRSCRREALCKRNLNSKTRPPCPAKPGCSAAAGCPGSSRRPAGPSCPGLCRREASGGGAAAQGAGDNRNVALA